LQKEFLGEDSRKRSKSQWETITGHGEDPALCGKGTSKWDMKEALQPSRGGGYSER